MKKNAFVIAVILWGLAVQAWAGCPTNELIQNTQTPIIFSYEKRDGTGEDTTNTANKKVSFAYYNGTAWRWYNGTDWTATSESQIAMTQLTGGQYYYLLSAAALGSTVVDKHIVIRFDEIDDVDVTISCMSYVQPEKRLTITKVWDEPKTSHTTAGTFGYYLDAQVSAAGGGSDPWTTALPGAYGAGTAGKIVGDALAAHTPQSGDSFARLGAPAGASVSADIATVKSDTAAVLVDTGTSGVVVADKTGYSLSAAGIDVIWDEAQAGHTTAGTFGRHLDAQISTSGSGATAVTAGTGNSSAWRIPIDETTVITANGQYIGAKLTCSKETREVVDTVQGTPDLIIVEPGNLFTSAPASVSCDLDWR